MEEKVKNSGNNFNLKWYRDIITKFFSLQNRKLLTTPVKKPQHLEIERSGSNLKNDAYSWQVKKKKDIKVRHEE